MALHQNNAVDFRSERFQSYSGGDDTLTSNFKKVKISDVMNRQVGRIEIDGEPTMTQNKIWAAGQRYACVFSDKTMVGVIDIFRAIERSANGEPGSPEKGFDWKVGVVSGSDYWNCSPETDADEVYNTMKVNEIECIPIFDEQAVVGVATRSDLAKIFEA